MMHIVLAVLALLVVAATLIPLARATRWWVRAFDFPRLQILVLGLLGLLGLVLAPGELSPRLLTLLVGVAGCVLYQAWRMLPYTPLMPRQVRRCRRPHPQRTVSLLAANVWMGNRDYGRFLELVRRWRPAVLLAVETDEGWTEALRELRDEYPWSVEQSQDDTYGMVLYSRLELIDPQVRFLVEDHVPSVHTRIRLPGGQAFWLHGLHPRPPAPTEAEDSAERDAELLVLARQIREREEATIVAGDLNDVAWSATTCLMQRLTGLLDPRVGRGLFSTFHAKIAFLRWPLDHVFHSVHFELLRLERLPAFGSDHFPIFIELCLDPMAPFRQHGPQPEPGDRREAAERIAEAMEGRERPEGASA